MSEYNTEEQAYVKRANFYIMRKLWVVIRGKRRNGQTIHGRLGTSRPRYTRFIYGESTRITHEEYSRWESLGINKGVIDGRELIKIPHLKKEDWEKFFNIWDESRKKPDDKMLENQLKKTRTYIDNKIESIKKGEIDTATLQSIYILIEESSDKRSPSFEKIHFTMYWLRCVSLTDLLETKNDQLSEYISTLREQLKLAEAVEIIRPHIPISGEK